MTVERSDIKEGKDRKNRDMRTKRKEKNRNGDKYYAQLFIYYLHL